jgi:hypothetical protein
MRVPRNGAPLLLGLCFAAVSLYAHHFLESTYDTSRTVTLTGVVTSTQWRNPHVILHLAVKNENGSVTEWRLEMRGANRLSAVGLDQNTIVSGNQVSVTAWPAKNGTKYGNARNLLLPDGRNLDVGDTWPQR